MQVVNYDTAQNNLNIIMRDISTNAKAYHVMGEEHEVVMISLSEFNAMKESLYLFSTRTNANRLMDAVKDVEEGHVHT